MDILDIVGKRSSGINFTFNSVGCRGTITTSFVVQQKINNNVLLLIFFFFSIVLTAHGVNGIPAKYRVLMVFVVLVFYP